MDPARPETGSVAGDVAPPCDLVTIAQLCLMSQVEQFGQQ